MHASAAAQTAAKRAIVERALAPLGPIAIEMAAPAAALGYRRRARLAWEQRGGTLAIGFRERRGRAIADVASCIVLAPELDAALATVRARLGPRLPEGSGEMHLAMGERAPVIGLDTTSAPARSLYAELEGMVREGVVAGAFVRAAGAGPSTFGDAREVSEDVEGRRISAPAPGFSQAHAETNRRLGAKVLELAAPLEGTRVVELYAGSGNLTLALASRAAHVRAVEMAADAAASLAENLAAHGLRAEVVAGDAAARAAAKKSERADVVVLDPPRTGAKDAIEAIASLRPDRVVYVSCDAATLARDLALLAARGYHLDAAAAFDMFPQTPHVEVVARMRRVR
jgi:23S rRNA (uracil1939-C5)-methyltransferase